MPETGGSNLIGLPAVDAAGYTSGSVPSRKVR